jgi:hypothetical protein
MGFQDVYQVQPSARFVVDFKERKLQANIAQIFDVLVFVFFVRHQQWYFRYFDAYERFVVGRTLFHYFDVVVLQVEQRICMQYKIAGLGFFMWKPFADILADITRVAVQVIRMGILVQNKVGRRNYFDIVVCFISDVACSGADGWLV